MRNTKRIQADQLEHKLKAYKTASEIVVPSSGWINNIRTSLNMTMEQLGNRLGISRQGVKKVEERETSGAISIKNLKEVGNALDMQLVYGFVPKDGSVYNLIDRKAKALAKRIVLRTSHNMKLEDQGTSDEKVEKAIEALSEEIKREMRKALWD